MAAVFGPDWNTLVQKFNEWLSNTAQQGSKEFPLLVQAIGNFHLSDLAFCELNRRDRRRRRKRTLFSLAICETQKRMKISDFRFQHNYNQRRDYTDIIVLSKHKYNSLFRWGRVVHVTITLQLLH